MIDYSKLNLNKKEIIKDNLPYPNTKVNFCPNINLENKPISNTKKEDKLSIKDILHYILVIVFIVGFGTMAVNMVLEYHYKAQFLQKPCDLCVQLNPNIDLEKCFYRKGITTQNINNVTELLVENLKLIIPTK